MTPTRDRRTGPWLFRRGLVCLHAVLLLLISSYPVRAHDPPIEFYGRNITVRIQPPCIRVVYRLELSQLALKHLPQRDPEVKIAHIGPTNPEKLLREAALERFKVYIPDKLLGELNGKPLQWTIEKTRIDSIDSVHFLLFLRADWSPLAANNRFEIKDTTEFWGDTGTFKLSVDADDGINLTDLREPKERSKRPLDPDQEQTASGAFDVEAAYLGSQASDFQPIDVPPPPPEPSFWERIRNNDLSGLLAHNYGFWLLLLIALIHGAGHSLMPGHGKTMVAAYLVGERGTPWHAVLLGIVTTLTHTSAAIAIAVAIRYTTAKAETINSLLLFIGGLTLAALGIWLFLQRIAGRSDHVHLFDMGHGHSHGDTTPVSRNVGTLRLILLGMAGGIIPCWGAIVWVIGCIATSQFWLALPIVLAFSIGLSSVLVLIGLSVVYSGRMGNSRWGERDWFKRIVRWLPVFGATIVIAIGIFMCSTSGIANR